MKPLSLAGLIGLAGLGAQAQVTTPYAVPPQPLESVVVTATRSLAPATPTLRDAVVITREDLDESGSLSLAEVLQRRAGVEIRTNGGPGQPASLFLRGANSAQTLVLVDGVRMNSAVGGASVENIPVDMIERIEVVKGPLSGLYGADAIGGVVQVFTRGKAVPNFFATGAFGTDRDWRIASGVTGVDEYNSFSINIGGRKVDAPSATNDRNFCFDPDRDPYENAYFEAKGAHRLWQGEILSITTFVSQGKTHFDGCPDANGQRYDDLNKQTLSGVGLASESQFLPNWKSRLSYNFGRDDLRITGSSPSHLETQQDQLTWVNEFDNGAGATLLAGADLLRQKIITTSDAPFARNHRDIDALFAGINQAWAGQRFEGNIRVDHDPDDAQFGTRNTGSASYGLSWPGWLDLSITYGTGFRSPTFFELYAAPSDFFLPNPNLLPERSRSTEVTLKSEAKSAVQWRITGFNNRIDDLIVFVSAADPTQPGTVDNVAHARIRGVEASVDAAWLGVHWRVSATAQHPLDDKDKRLPGRAERFASLDVTKRFNDTWSAGVTVFASGDRFDATGEAPSSHLGGYTVADARVRYTFDKRWSAELAATNLFDKKHESAVGYDAPRRGLLLSVRFDAI